MRQCVCDRVCANDEVCTYAAVDTDYLHTVCTLDREQVLECLHVVDWVFVRECVPALECVHILECVHKRTTVSRTHILLTLAVGARASRCERVTVRSSTDARSYAKVHSRATVWRCG